MNGPRPSPSPSPVEDAELERLIELVRFDATYGCDPAVGLAALRFYVSALREENEILRIANADLRSKSAAFTGEPPMTLRQAHDGIGWVLTSYPSDRGLWFVSREAALRWAEGMGIEATEHAPAGNPND